MKLVHFIVSALLTGLVLTLVVQPAAARSADAAEDWNAPAVEWLDVRAGVQKSIATGKTVLMVFHAPWCTACRQYREVFKDPRIVEASRDYVMVLVDADADKLTNGAFAPDGTYVPRTLFMTPDGDVRSDLVGATDPEHPHTIDIKSPEELLSLMLKGASSKYRSIDKPDQRASN